VLARSSFPGQKGLKQSPSDGMGRGVNLERVSPRGGEQLPAGTGCGRLLPWFSRASHLGAHRKRWESVGDQFDSFMPSWFLVLRTSGVFLSGGL